jgi:hypothetical protein
MRLCPGIRLHNTGGVGWQEHNLEMGEVDIEAMLLLHLCVSQHVRWRVVSQQHAAAVAPAQPKMMSFKSTQVLCCSNPTCYKMPKARSCAQGRDEQELIAKALLQRELQGCKQAQTKAPATRTSSSQN